MNRIYRLVFNRALGVMQVASELASGSRSSGRRGVPRFARALLAAGLSLALQAQAQNLPGAGTISQGSATIDTTVASTTTINQTSQRAVIDWASFNIAAGYAVNFTGDDIVTLNRVAASGGGSTIAGTLTSTGTVFLLNPNGVVFGSGAQVNVGGLVVSTLSMGDQDFMAGRYIFTGSSSGTGVEVDADAQLTASSGPVVLLGNAVRNAGQITAARGSINLASGKAGTLTFNGDGTASMSLRGTSPAYGVRSSGTLTGRVVDILAYVDGNAVGTVVSNTGTIVANAYESAPGSVSITARGGDMEAGNIQSTGTVKLSSVSALSLGTVTADSLVATAGSTLTTGSTNTAGDVSLQSGGALRLGDTHIGGSLNATSDDGGISQSSQLVVAGKTTLSTGGNILLANAANDFGDVVDASGGDITLVDANDLFINSLFSANNANVSLTAGGTLALPAQAIDTGIGMLVLASLGGGLSSNGALSGGDIAMTGRDGITLIDDVSATGTLSMDTTNANIVQTAGTITVGGTTTLDTGTGAITLAQTGNDFGGAVSATGGAVELHDTNALALGTVSVNKLTATAGGALTTGTTTATGDVTLQSGGALNLGASEIGGALVATSTGGSISQSGAVSVTGTSTLTAAGAVVLANGDNDFGRAVSYSGQGVALYDTNDLTVASLDSTANTAVWRVAGGTLTLPAGDIDTGTAALTLASLGGSLSSGGALSGGDIALVGRDGITLSSDVSASGTLSMDTTNAAIVQTAGAIIAAGTTALDTGTGAITLAQAGNDFGGAVGVDGNVVTLRDANDLTLAPISASSLTLNAGATISADAIDVGTFTLQGGNWIQNAATLPTFNATDFRLAGGTFLRALGGDGSTASPWQITDVYGLQGIGTLLSSTFVLTNDIDASGTTKWWSGAGFKPIGGESTNFTGSLDGQEHTINGMFIRRPNEDNVGLFGYTGSGSSISNLGLLAGSATGASVVGSLVGYSQGGSISNAYATGNVSGSSYVGGMVGFNAGSISDAYANGDVTGGNGADSGNAVGGLVGENTGSISNSYATGNVVGGSYAGGLVGFNAGSITASFYATTDAADNAINIDLSTVGDSNDSATIDTISGGRTHAQLTDIDTFTTEVTAAGGTAWNLTDAGGDGSTWRIYDGNTAPLLRSFLAAVTVTADNGASKVYDATTTATGASYTVSDTAASLLGTATLVLDSKNAGQRTLSVSGLYSTQQGYDITLVDGSYTVNKATLTTDITASDKVYDATTAATTTGALSGILGNDQVSLATSGSFADKNVGTAKTVTVSGYLSGTDAGNYALDGNTSTTADITPATLTITANDASKAYGQDIILDGYTLSGMIGSDSLDAVTLTSSDTAIGAVAGIYAIVPSDATGTGLSNYNLHYIDGSLTVMSPSTNDVGNAVSATLVRPQAALVLTSAPDSVTVEADGLRLPPDYCIPDERAVTCIRLQSP